MALFTGIDLGTSGCRVTVINDDNQVVSAASGQIDTPLPDQPGRHEQEAATWWDTMIEVLQNALSGIPAGDVVSICVDGTSSTLLLADRTGNPLGSALMYNDTRCKAESDNLDHLIPQDSAAYGAGSSLARLMYLGKKYPDATYALHQADWLTGKLSGQYGHSDENNCLKLGYVPGAGCWPDWIKQSGINTGMLPQVHEPGTPIALIKPEVADLLGLSHHTRVVAGTTDSTAAFLATGAHETGDAVTSLGSTLVLKVISDKPVFSRKHGVYSHRISGKWLCGGASNSGGAALLRFFTVNEMNGMMHTLKPEQETGLDYYPLPGVGERFPVSDPGFQPRLPNGIPDNAAERSRIFQGLLEGISRIEGRGYQLLAELGAPCPKRVLTVGGGSANPAWNKIRQNLLQVPVIVPAHHQASYGTALLAKQGAN
ncbi:MAG TPA: carbohydrate kinase [Gammaproteobacteria bacterium]|nr:carbohydrate kinase [Gammaproteobacteria bacterium]